MGNSTLQAAFKQYRKDIREKDGAKQGEQPCITAEALLLDEAELVAGLAKHVREAMRVDGELDEKTDYVATNVQKNSETEDLKLFHAHKALAEVNARFVCGFKTAESNIEDLSQPPHERHFTVLTDQDAQQDYHKVQRQKTQILYGLYLLRQRIGDSKGQTFAEYVQAFLKDTDDGADQLAGLDGSEIKSQRRSRAGIQVGFGFVLVLLREMKAINNGSLLTRSLEHVLQTLKQVEPGSFHSGDRLSFVLDASLNDARAFLLELISESGTDRGVVALAYKVVLMLGLARSSVEDLLLLCSLLKEKQPSDVDLRDELKILRDMEAKQLRSISKDEEFDSGGVKTAGRSPVKMPLCSAGSHGIKVNHSSDSWVLDGHYFFAFISGKGLIKLQTGSQGGMPGRIVAVNSELDKAKASLMLLDGKLYFRNEDIKPTPFVIIDKDTLQEVKMEPELKFEPKEGQTQSLQWTEENEETGRSLAYTPLVTDGTYVYVIARQGRPKGEQAPEDEETVHKLVVEVYDPANSFEFVRAVTLYKDKHFEPFVKEKNSEDWLRAAQWATNGTVLACFTGNGKVRFFSLETGAKVSKRKTDFSSDGIVVYDGGTNQFVHLSTESSIMQYQAFDFPNFKQRAAQSSTSAGLDKLEEELLADNSGEQEGSKSLQTMNLIEQIMHGVSSADLAAEARKGSGKGGVDEKSRARAPGLARALILRLLSRRCRSFKMHLQVASQGSEREGSGMMSVFRYPLVTYLTASTFVELGQGMKACVSLLEKPADGVDLHELYSMLYLLELVRANFQALSFCSINLTSLLTKESDYAPFMSAFKSCVMQLADEDEKAAEKRVAGAANEEVKELWANIAKVSKEIMASSIRLLHKGPDEILESLKTSLTSGEGSKCEVQISYVAQVEHLRTLMSGEPAKASQKLEEVLEVFSEIAKLDSKMLRNQLQRLEIDKIDEALSKKEQEDPQLVSACQRFLLNFSEEIASRYCTVSEQAAKRQQASNSTQLERKQSQDSEDAKLELKRLEKAVCRVADVCYTELSEHFNFILEALKQSCESKAKDDQWEGVEEKFKKYSTAASRVLRDQSALYQMAMLYTQTFGLHRPQAQQQQELVVTQRICGGAVRTVTSLSLLYTIWTKYGEKLGLGEKPSADSSSSLVDDTLQALVAKLRRHLSWYVGHIAYELIKIENKDLDQKKKDEKGEQDEQKKREKRRKQVLQMIVSSNLLSGGIEAQHLQIFSQEAQDQLAGQAKLMGDEALLQALGGQEDGDKTMPAATEEDATLEAIIYQGKDQDTDLAIMHLQRILETRQPMVPFARLGGADGLRMSRAAFAVMVKFSDLLDDFTALVDQVGMQAQIEEDRTSVRQTIVALIKEQPQAETIIRRWESAARMRQWINEKKHLTSQKLEKKVRDELRKKKVEEKKKEEAKKAEAAESENKESAEKDVDQKEEKDQSKEAPAEAKATEQIDSSSKPATKEDEKEEKAADQADKDKDNKEVEELTAEDEVYISDEAFNRLESKLAKIYTKLQAKAQFMTRLRIPVRFQRRDPTRTKEGQLMMLRAPSTFADVPAPKLDWEGRLKSWKQMQTSQGAIKSLTERKAEIWNSGITSILALLQTPIDTKQIQKQVEKTYIDSCRRTTGLKLIRELIKVDMPTSHLYDVINWFSASLRCNKNRLTHYLDDTKGQGIHLESKSRKYFFEILGALIQRLKVSKDEKEIKTILNALKWKFTGRDHGDLAQLNIFALLHKGNGEKDNKLRKAWGRKVEADCTSADDQSVSKAVLEMFEQLFLAVAGRIVEPDFGGTLKLKSAGSGALPQLQKAKSVIDENVSETLLGQAFEVIFKEFERYINIMSGFQGVDWSVYVRMRNQERKDEDSPKELVNEDDVLLDEVDKEDDAEGDKEEDKAEEQDKAEDEATTEKKDEEKKDAEGEPEKQEEKKAEKEPEEKASDEKAQEDAGEAEKQSKDADKEADKASEKKDSDDEEGSAKEDDDEEQRQREEVAAKSKEREERELKQLTQLYSETFLKRLLRLVEIFTSIANSSSHPLSMVQRVANPYHLSSLLNLLILSSPSVKIVVLKVIQHIVKISIPFEVFEEAVRIFTRDKSSLAHRILHKMQPEAKFEQSMFLKFLFNYLLSLRSKMWCASDAESEGQYAVSQTVSATLRVISSVPGKGDFWSKVLKEEITKALLNIEKLRLDEADAILSLLPGGEYGGVTAGDQALTSKNQVVTVLGYSSSWKAAQALFPADQSAEDMNKTLKKLSMSPEFTDAKQMAVALFYDKNQKSRQDMMLLHPSSLSPIAGLDEEETLSAAKISPLMDSAIAKHLVSVLKTSEEELQGLSASSLAALRQKQSQILKTLGSQIDVMGQAFIDFLHKENLLEDLMAYLYQDIKNISSKPRAASNHVVPVKWLEAKLQNMRKLAIETNRSLNLEKEDVKVFLLNKKELVFKRTDPQTKNVTRTNAYLTSAVNLHKVAPDTLYQCYNSNELDGLDDQAKQVMKYELVVMEFSELGTLSPRALSILNSSDAIMTTQPDDLDVKELFKKILAVYKADQEASAKERRKYENLLETVIYFVSEDDFERCTKPIQTKAKDSNEPAKSQLARLLDDLSEWGGLDKDQILYNLKKSDINDMGAVMALVEEGLLAVQAHEQKYQDELKMHQKSNDEEAIKKLEASEETRRQKRLEVIEEKRQTLLADDAAEKANDQKDGSTENEVPVFDEFSKDESWWKELQEVVKKKLSVKPDKHAQSSSDEQKKNDEQMTKLLHAVSTTYDANQLQYEHARVVDQMLVEQRKVCLFGIINEGDQEEVLPDLLKSEEAQSIFSKFLNMQFNASVIQMLQIGQKKSYQQIKQKMKSIFAFCRKSKDLNQFIKAFLLKEVLRAGVKSVQDFRVEKTKKVTDYFQIEEKAVNGLNPYLLRFMCCQLVKEDSVDLITIKNCLATLLNLHLCMVLYFQDHKSLVRKLLKSCLKLITYAKKHLVELIKSEELAGIVQNKLVKLVTSEINFKDEQESENKKLSEQQLLFLEVHLQIDSLHQMAVKSHNTQVGKVLEDSEAICQVKRNKKIIQERDSFGLLKYLYHLEHLEDHQKDLMNVNIETNHPAFDVMTRAFIEVPQVQRLKIKFKDTMKLKDLTYVGISNDPSSNITLKSMSVKEFDWPAGSFYLFYPIQKQCVVGFGQNSSQQLGETTENFKVPAISTPDEASEESFRPERVLGCGRYSIAVSSLGEYFETGELDGCTVPKKFTKVSSLKAKVRLAAVAPQSAVVVLEDNTIWYKGTSVDYHFPNNESKGSFAQLKLWADQTAEEKIVDITSGYGYTLAVTENGALWAWGKRFLDAIDQTSKDPIELKLPQGTLCRRAWAPGGPDSESSACAFVELEECKTGKKHIYSAGKSEKGMLGQGDKAKESREFKKIFYESDDLIFTTLSVGNESVIAIDSAGQLWGWGHNENHRLGLSDVAANGIPKPFALYPLNNLGLKAKRVSCGSVHSLVLFEDKKGKLTLYSVGNKLGSEYAHLGTTEDQCQDPEKPVREIKTFSGRKLVDFLAHDSASVVILAGGATAVDNLYAHTLPNGKQVHGLLHFFKQGGEWHFIPQDEYEAKKSELPDLSFAIKCPVEDLQSLEWPDLDALAKEVFDDVAKGDSGAPDAVHEGITSSKTGKEVQGTLYHTRCLINHEEIEYNHDENSIFEGTENSLNPLIYFRVARPMKKGAKLPSIALEKYYKQDSRHGIDIEIIPDLTYEVNDQLIKATQELWDEIIESDAKFDLKYKRELLDVVDSKLSGIIANKKIEEVNFEKDLKVGELEFKDKGLKKLSERAKKQKAALFWMLNTYFFKILPYNSSLLKGVPGSVFELVQATKSSLLKSTKNKFIDDEIAKLPTGSESHVTVKRGAALRFKDTGKCDHTGEFSIFGQIFQKHKKDDGFKNCLRMNTTDSHAFSVTMAGEGAIDVGGPFRECLCNMVDELESEVLPLLIKTPNNRNDHGSNRECFMLNPASQTPTHQELFVFLGYLLGFSIRSKSAMNWHFPGIFWKQLLGETVNLADFDGLDAYSAQIMKDIRAHGATLTPEAFDAAVDETFETYLANGQAQELKPGGKDIAVSHANHKEYLDLVIKKRLEETEKQMDWLRQGVTHVVDLSVLAFLTWEEVELRACGPKDIDLEALKAITNYHGASADHKTIKMFWQMFENFTQEERRKYLKFVWGRSKLPADTSDLSDQHSIQVCSDRAVDALPEAHTCFFAIDVPVYVSLEAMTSKFKTAIELCGEIDGDYSPSSIADEDGNRGTGRDYDDDY